MQNKTRGRLIELLLLLAASGLAFAAFGCSKDDAAIRPDVVARPFVIDATSASMAPVNEERLLAFRDLWKSKSVSNYDVVLFRHAVDIAPSETIRTKIRDGKIASIQPSKLDSDATPRLEPRDIDDLFEMIERTFGYDFPKPSASFDTEFGYPTHVELEGMAPYLTIRVDVVTFRVVGENEK